MNLQYSVELLKELYWRYLFQTDMECASTPIVLTSPFNGSTRENFCKTYFNLRIDRGETRQK